MDKDNGRLPTAPGCEPSALAVPASRSRIPSAVYYRPETANFYDARTRQGMGLAFWAQWRCVSDIFPQSAASAIEAATAGETHSGSTEGESAAPNGGDAQGTRHD